MRSMQPSDQDEDDPCSEPDRDHDELSPVPETQQVPCHLVGVEVLAAVDREALLRRWQSPRHQPRSEENRRPGNNEEHATSSGIHATSLYARPPHFALLGRLPQPLREEADQESP
jgi:hypothetical protein